MPDCNARAADNLRHVDGLPVEVTRGWFQRRPSDAPVNTTHSSCITRLCVQMDRLITELQLSPLEAYHHINRILEQANVIMSELYTAELMAGLSVQAAARESEGLASPPPSATVAAGNSEQELVLAADGSAATTSSTTSITTGAAPDTTAGSTATGAGAGDAQKVTFDAWGIDVDEKAEAALFFDPTRGNVVFGSAIDGWAFTLDNFAVLHATKLELSRPLLRRALWGDYYYKPKVS